MAISPTGTLLGNPFHPRRTASPQPSPDDSGAWQLGPIPDDLDLTPWVFEDPDAPLPTRRRWLTARRVLTVLALFALAAGALARLDPWSLGWRHATQAYLTRVLNIIPG